MESNVRSFLPGLASSDIIQLRVFLTVFLFSSLALVGNWLGYSYVLNNSALILICFFTFAIPPAAKIFYLFSYALLISPILDVFIIGFNWHEYDKEDPTHLFVLSFLVALFFLPIKIYLGLHQFEIAKILNGEESPISISSVINTNALKQHWEQQSASLKQFSQQQSVVLREQCSKKSAVLQEQCQLTINRIKNRATASMNQAKSSYNSDVENPMLQTNITRIYNESPQHNNINIQAPVFKKPFSREAAPSPKIERRQPIYMNKNAERQDGFSPSE